MVLVDSSVWTEVFGKPARLRLEEVVDFEDVVIVRSGVDCIVAACAIRHGLSVLHRDRDYDRLARISSLESRRV